MPSVRLLVEDALRVLGVRNLVLGIQDPSFPNLADEDTGRGSPYTEGGGRFLRFVSDLGFSGIQLGPQGQTSESNSSPYDGTIFSRNTLSIALAPLAHATRWGGLLSRERLESIVASSPPGSESKVKHRYAYRAQREALEEVFCAFLELRERGRSSPSGDPRVRAALVIADKLEAFRREHWSWLERDALYEPLCIEHASAHWRSWGGERGQLDQRLWSPGPSEHDASERRRQALRDRYSSDIERYALFQLIAHEQHAELRELTASLGLKLYGDLQIGYSEQDVWSYQSTFLTSYLMGAPPSRTNPEGQPWNYPVFAPSQYFEGGGRAAGPALRLLLARIDKLFTEFDGIRIDHPHGLVCPWVYKAGEADALRAVQSGARLFASPDLPDHPELRQFAVVAPEQLNHNVPRYADDWVTALSVDQVHRYGALFNAIINSARKNGREISDLVCEVLSTKPYPLGRVLEQYGLGRFRVTQKANLKNPADVYRSENARPEDWIMVGNHDTKPIWLLAAQWQESGAAREQADHLASLLLPDAGATARGGFADEIASDPKKLAQAKLAELFTSKAQNVMIFFSDLFGDTRVFNAPGTVNEENWSLRLPSDYEQRYGDKIAEGGALCLPKALAMALRSRGGAFASAQSALIAHLEEAAAGMERGVRPPA